MASGFGCIFLTPVPTYLLQSSGLCSPLPSARAQALHSLGEDVEVWDRRATAITGTAWGLGALGGWVGHSCTLRGPLSPPSVVTGGQGSLPITVACAVLVGGE